MTTYGWRSFKHELIVGIGSTIFLLGIFAAAILIISKIEHQKTLWVSVSIAGALFGWIMVRTQAKGFIDTFKIMLGELLSTIFNPLNWFNW
ncbi:MAG TPA: hypothetical protein VH234_03765 [Candidatus Saccharimonadales bacterium]|jgi:hypothetical protein|nr:hypothetical protein [Candidatus Saccharimonadales bacterium]